MTTIRVRQVMDVDVNRDEAEWWPHIVAASSEQDPFGAPLLTGQTKTAECAWDLVEAIYGNPPPAKEYVISVRPVGRLFGEEIVDEEIERKRAGE